MNYATVAKKDEKSFQTEQYLCSQLNKHGWIYDKKNPELVICIGGDGTLLYGVHKYLPIINTIKFLGIHTGTLGFFTDYTGEEIDECIQDLLHKKPSIFTSNLLKIQMDNDPVPRYALNEMRVENIVKSQILDIYIGLSKQAGSTAYNRSLKGAVIDSGISLMQLTEITPIQHSKHRSLGVPYIMMENRIITMRSETFDTAVLCYDHLNLSLADTHEIICSMSDLKVQFVRYRAYSYLKRLKNLY